MRLADLISDVETIAALGSNRRTAVRNAIRQRLMEYAASYDWPHYRDIGSIQTINDYTTGTVSVTNGSRTVTGSGTTFPTLSAGRKIRIGTENHFYYVATRDSATQLTLRDPYMGSTQSGVTYTLFQDEYKLEANTHKLLDVIQLQDSLVMVGLSYLDMDRWFPDPDQLNDPTYFSLIGRRDDRYTAGTIATTANSRTVTGTNTEWLSVPGFSRGTRVSVTDTTDVLTVDTVDSDTQFTAYELATTTDASSAYRAFLNNLVVQLRDVPDETRLLYYRKQRVPYPLVRDEDEPDLPREYHYGLVWGGLVTAFALQGNQPAATEAERRWKDWIALQRIQLAQDSPTVQYPRQSVDAHILDSLRLGYGRLPTNYGYVLG